MTDDKSSIVPSASVRPRLRRIFVIAFVVLLPAAVHAVWDQVEATLLAREIARIARRHEPVSLGFLRFPLSVPDERRAARLYASAAEIASWKLSEYPSLRKLDPALDVTTPGGRPGRSLDDLRAEFIDGEPSLELLDLASPLFFAGFSSIAPELNENGSALLDLNSLNCLRADLSSIAGDADAAVNALIASVRLQRTLPAQFYRSASGTRLLGSLRLLLRDGHPDSAALERLQRAYASLPDTDDMVEDLMRARARLLGDFWPYPADGASWALRARQFRPRGVMDTVGFVILRPWLTHQLRQQLPAYEEAIAVARGTFPEKLDRAAALFKREFPGGRPVRSSTGMPPGLAVWIVNTNLPIAASSLAQRRVSVATIAVERFRRDHGEMPPQRLEDLVPAYLKAVPQDPFSGQPLRYVLTRTDYTIYSVDVDRVDDGGVVYGFGSGVKSVPSRAGETSPRDISIRVPL